MKDRHAIVFNTRREDERKGLADFIGEGKGL